MVATARLFNVKHFLNINQISYDEACHLIKRALLFKKDAIYPRYPHKILANLFYENSTRTRISFELAAKHMNINVVNMDLDHSSESKGEEIRDTIKTIASMGVNIAVIRHIEEGLPHTISEYAPNTLHIINAGDGAHAHPTQAMLDFMTLFEHKPNLSYLKIAIVGNLKHSRVAHSLQAMCQLFQVKELALIAPAAWLPDTPIYGHMTTSLKEGLHQADVIVTLRVQHERFQPCDYLNLSDYHRDYSITVERIKLAKPDAIVMHPGPLNRGVEIDSVIADGPQSCIWEQVKNGVFMRMAIIEKLFEDEAQSLPRIYESNK
jgi:aspartate carbamoyltransferase catalytic subunit